MPLTFGDTHPSAMPAAGPVDTADMLFSMDEVETELHPRAANSSLEAMVFSMDEVETELHPRVANSSLEAMVFSVAEEQLLQSEHNIKKQMLWMRGHIEGLCALRDRLQADTRRLQADNSSLQADKTGLQAEIRRIDTENRSLQAQVRRFNDAWRQIAHVSRSALKQPVPAP